MKKLLLPLISLLVCTFTVPRVEGGTLIVTSTADSGAGSLRDAIAAASDGDTIQFDATLNGQAITLTSDHLFIDKDLTIDGPGAHQLTVKRSTAGGTPIFRIFRIAPLHTVTIQGMTINNGVAQSGSPSGTVAGGILNDGSTLTISNSVISGNSARYGGGVFNSALSTGSATLTINNSTISGNSAVNDGFGGGIYNYGTGNSNFAVTTMNYSTVSGNSAAFGAGICNVGLFEGHAFVIIENSTISGNAAAQGGGAISNYGTSESESGYVSVHNSTLSDNSAVLGGAIYNDSTKGNTTLMIGISTISDNPASQGGGIYNVSSSYVSIASSILKAGTPEGTIYGFPTRVISSGYNLLSDNGGGFVTATGDQINTDPLLGPLQNNGGPTLTRELLAGSPAINAGYPTYSPPPDYDQRGSGFPRVADGRLDIGSFERQTATPLPTTLLNISTRLRVLTGDNALIGGFIVTGNVPKRVIIRAIGPSLTSLGVPGALADPTLELHGPGAFITIPNNNWRDTQEAEIETTGLAPSSNLESAIVATLPPGAYTAVVRGNDGGTGVGLVEAYDLDSAADARLANISTRGFVDSGDNVMIGGFILGNGSANARVLIRAIGPSLAAFGVADALVDPTLELRNNNGDIMAANDDWRQTQQTEIEMTGLPPSDSRESAIVQDLAPGAYTAIVRGKNNATGVALVEGYRVP